MERSLHDYIDRKLEIESALSAISKHYFSASKPRRFISGVAVSSRAPNANQDSFVARGMEFNLPAPLLWTHTWTRPLGRVIAIEARGDQVLFKAEVANAMPWVDQIWRHIIARNADRVSLEGYSLADPVIDRTYARWRLNELSVVQCGADRGAILDKVWESVHQVYLDGRSSTTLHWSV